MDVNDFHRFPMVSILFFIPRFWLTSLVIHWFCVVTMHWLQDIRGNTDIFLSLAQK